MCDPESIKNLSYLPERVLKRVVHYWNIFITSTHKWKSWDIWFYSSFSHSYSLSFILACMIWNPLLTDFLLLHCCILKICSVGIPEGKKGWDGVSKSRIFLIFYSCILNENAQRRIWYALQFLSLLLFCLHPTIKLSMLTGLSIQNISCCGSDGGCEQGCLRNSSDSGSWSKFSISWYNPQSLTLENKIMNNTYRT